MNRFKLCLTAVALCACAFSCAPAVSGNTGVPPVSSSGHSGRQNLRAEIPHDNQAASLSYVAYVKALHIEQALPADRWRDIIAPVALALAACAYVAKRFRSLGCLIRYLKHLAKEQWQGLQRIRLRLKLVLRNILALCDLRVFGVSSYRTANAAPAAPPKNEMVELLSKGAGVDPEDVYWRVARGLSPKQAVDVAAQEKLERQVNDFAKKNEKKTDDEIRALAKDRKVDPATLPDMSRQQLLIAIVKADNAKEGIPAPGETTTTPAAANQTSEPKPIAEMTVAELKAEAAKRNVDVTGLKTKKDLVAALK